jgi:hypothetical protein
MEKLELFPEVQHIPQWLADYFRKANAGDYPEKKAFYSRLKPLILKTFAEFAGYDLQIIEKKCHTCDGTGQWGYWRHDGGDTCWSCNGEGIYETKAISLERYLLNGVIYHIPCYELKAEPHKNRITGHIKHEPVNGIDAHRAYIILLWKYNKEEFYRTVWQFIADYPARMKAEIRTFCQSLIRKDNTKDELPF